MTIDPATELTDKATLEGLGLLLLISWSKSTMTQLLQTTNKDRKTIGRILARLESRGIIERGREGHADRFYLIAESLQLPLPELGRISPVGKSSSSLVVIEGTPIKTTTTTPTGENLPSCKHHRFTELVKFLTDDIGCPSRRMAERSISAALNDGMEPTEIKYEALWWWLYWASGDGKSIDNIGIFIARKIEGGETVREGYTYNERKARGENSRLVDLFREIEYLYNHKIGDASDDRKPA